MANHQRQRTLPAGRLLHTRTRNRSGAERDRKEGKHKLTRTKNLIIKKLREVRETSGLELDEEEAEPTIGRNFKTKFEITNDYSESILITDSDFILSDRTSAICITADMNFKSRLETDFKGEYQNVEFLFRQRPGWEEWLRFPHQFHKSQANTCAFW